MAKKPAPKKAAAKKTAAKPAPQKATPSKRPPAKKTVPAKKPAPKPATKLDSAPKATPAPAPAKKPEPVPVFKPVFESPAPMATPAPAPVSVPPPAHIVTVNKGTAPAGTPLTVSTQASAGAAANGNTHPANILVLVSSGGWPVTDLTKDNFTLMEYFEVPGQQAPFSNNITSFRNVGTGAYLLQVKPINSAPWRSGHHLAQIIVSSDDNRQGQGAVKIIIR
ncbi:MAG: hypothetical protein RIS79_3210 [Verrucomicrobiota bacterium]